MQILIDFFFIDAGIELESFRLKNTATSEILNQSFRFYFELGSGIKSIMQNLKNSKIKKFLKHL